MKKYSFLLSSVGLKQSILTIIGNTFGTAFSALALVLFSRVLGPEKFGEFSVGFAIVMILTRVNDIGLNTAILKYATSFEKISDKNKVYSLTLKLKLYLSLVIFIFGVFSFNWIGEVLKFQNPYLILVAFIFGLTTVYYEQLLSMLQSLHYFFQAVVINALQAIAKLAGALLMVFLGLKSSFFAFSWYVLAPILPVIFAKFILPKEVNLKLSINDSQLNSKIWTLAKHSAIGLISAGIIENVDILFLQKYLSTYETGLFAGVSRIALLFSLAAYSLGNVLYPRVAKYHQKKDIGDFLKKALGIVFLSILGFLVLIPFSKFIILFSIGQQYMAGNSILLILTAASFLAIAAIPFVATFYSFQADWYFSVSGILQLIVVFVGNIVFVPTFGLEAAAWTRLITRLLLFVFTSGLSFYLYKRTYAKN